MRGVDAMTVDNSFSENSNPPRRFYLERLKDETGISRTGRVLEGILWQNGEVTVQWRPPHSTMGFYHSMDEFDLIHVSCHPSCNVVRWVDREAWHCFDCGAGGMEGNFCSRCGSSSTGFHPVFEGWEPTKRYDAERELEQLTRRRMELVKTLDGEK
jgi:hypothetical protein